MLGSAASISDANVVINTAVADILHQFADTLEQSENFEEDLHLLVKNTIREHRRILFNGNGYDDAWIAKAEKRGLLNLKTTPDALSHFLDEKNIKLFTENKVFSEVELYSRLEIMLENYCKVIHIEALTMLRMARSEILPSVSKYKKQLADAVVSVRDAGADMDVSYETGELKKISDLSALIYKRADNLEEKVRSANSETDSQTMANLYKDIVIPAMRELREAVDKAELVTAKEYWPYPTYGELLFGIR